VNNRLIRE